jgi:TIR domain
VQNEKKYDVFISYRWVSPDQEWVRGQLYPALLKAGLKVFLDNEDFIPGHSVISEMERAGLESRHVLCVISPEYFEEGRMVEFESLFAQNADPGGRRSFLIPLILREATMPPRIKGLIPVSWINPQDHRREWKRLLRTLGAEDIEAAPPGPLQLRNEERADKPLRVYLLFISTPVTGEIESVIPELREIVSSYLHTLEDKDSVAFEPKRDGVLLASFDNPSRLLDCALGIEKILRGRDDLQIYMGLHAAPVRSEDDQPILPDEEVEITRRVMYLGTAGHILASGEIVRLLRRQPGLARLFKPLGECEVAHGKRLAIYNIYYQDVGSDAQVRRQAKRPVLLSHSIPEEVTDLKPEEVILNFYPALPYARVKFHPRYDQVEITCDDQVNDDCVFEYDFSKGLDDYRQSFEIKVKKIQRPTEELEIIFYDERDNTLNSLVRHEIKLRHIEPPPPPPLWRRQSLLIPAASLLLAGLLFAAFHYEIPSPLVEHLKIRWGLKDPYRYVGLQGARFDGTDWDAPSDWRICGRQSNTLDDCKSPAQGDKALFIVGSGAGFYKLPPGDYYDYYAYYNAIISFDIVITQGQRSATWILRARNDKSSYYLIKMTFPVDKSGASIEGSIYKKGMPPTRLASPPQPLKYLEFHEGDVLTVTIEAREGSLKHWFYLVRKTPVPKNDGLTGIKIPTDSSDGWEISDQSKSFLRFGTVGFQGEDGEIMKVANLQINGLDN